MRILAVPIASKLRARGAAEAVMDRIAGLLKGVEVLPRIVDDIEGIRTVPRADAYVAIVLTGGCEHMVVELGLRRAPMLLVAHDSQNSLAAALEALAEIRRRGTASTLALFNPRFPDLANALRALKAYAYLRSTPLALIGDPSPWLVYSSQAMGIAEHLGLKFVRIGIERLIDELRRVRDEDTRMILDRFRGIEVAEGASKYLRKTAALYIALKRLLDDTGSRVFTIRCFDLIKHGVTACLALSMLNNEGYVAGCEGDIPALLTMALLKGLSGSPVFMGNVAWVEERRVFLAHCTVATKLVHGYRFRTHFESGIGVGIEGWPRRGERVTIARLDPLRKVLRAATGVIENQGPIREDWCRTQFAVRLYGDPSPIIRDPIGNHYVLVPGHWVEALRHLALLIDVELQLLDTA